MLRDSSIGNFFYGPNLEKIFPAVIAGSLVFQLISYGCLSALYGEPALVCLLLPFCFLPPFGLFALIGLFKGFQEKSKKLISLSLVLGAISGGPYTIGLPIFLISQIIFLFIRLIGLDDEVTRMIEDLISPYVTPNPPGMR